MLQRQSAPAKPFPQHARRSHGGSRFGMQTRPKMTFLEAPFAWIGG